MLLLVFDLDFIKVVTSIAIRFPPFSLLFPDTSLWSPFTLWVFFFLRVPVLPRPFFPVFWVVISSSSLYSSSRSSMEGSWLLDFSLKRLKVLLGAGWPLKPKASSIFSKQ